MQQALSSASALGIRPFDRYDIIIDARSPREYAEDHLPGAVNLPVVDDAEYAQVGTAHRTDPHGAYLIGVAWSLHNIADAIGTHISKLPRRAAILVYCFRGGKRSRLWADTLRTIGFEPDVLAGGWKRYRRWVLESLEQVPRRFDYRVLSGPTGCGKTRLLVALEKAGAQVLDLEGLAQHRGSVIGALPGIEQPAQKLFDTALLDKLLSFDPARPVWLEAESKKIGNLQLPMALFEAMHASPCYRLEAPMAERVRLWREDYRHFEADPQALLGRLEHLVPLVGRAEFEEWKALADREAMPALFERLMVAHYDPAYARSMKRNYGAREPAKVLQVPDLSPEALAGLARVLTAGG